MLMVNSRWPGTQTQNLKELTDGLRNAPNAAAKLGVIRFFQNRLKTDVLPHVAPDSDLAHALNQDVGGIVDIDPISRHLIDVTNNPLVINGDYVPEGHTMHVIG